MLFIDIISLFINLANKDACFSPDPVADFGEGATGGEKGKEEESWMTWRKGKRGRPGGKDLHLQNVIMAL